MSGFTEIAGISRSKNIQKMATRPLQPPCKNRPPNNLAADLGDGVVIATPMIKDARKACISSGNP
jgi:hypothetical protein